MSVTLISPTFTVEEKCPGCVGCGFCHMRLLDSVHTSPFSFELNAYFFYPFYRSSTLKRSKMEMFIYENGGFRKRFPVWRLLKTQVYRFSVDGKNGAQF